MSVPRDPPPPTATAAFLQRPAVVWLLLTLATLAVYAPALNGAPIWDDAYLVGENPFFRSPVFGLEVFRHYLFFDSFSTYYRPVQNWSYMVDYWLWRGLPLGYHLTNVAIHAGAGFFLYLLLRRLLPPLLGGARRAPIIALLVATVWTLHPIHTAAVAYISGRADSLAAFCALGAWLLLLRGGESAASSRKAAWFAAAAFALLLALCAKEIALVWIAFTVAHVWWKGAGSIRVRALTTLGILGVLGLYAVLHALPAAREPMQGNPAEPFGTRCVLMLRALGDYTGLIFFPANLHMERTLQHRSVWLPILGVATLLAAAVLTRWRAEGRALRVAGAAWFGFAFLPISNLFPLNAEVAEHWIYTASIGALLFLAGIALALPARAQRWAVAVTLLFAAGLGTRTAVRSGDWVEPETFFRRTLAAGGISPRVLISLASLYGQRGDLAQQEAWLRKLVERYPDFAPGHIQLGVCLARQQRSGEAEDVLEASTAQAALDARRFPRTWPAALQRAELRAKSGDRAGARELAREASVRFPEIWPVARFESSLVAEEEGAAAALPIVERFAVARWWHLDSRLELARLYAATGRADDAIAAYEHARQLDVYDTRPDTGIAQVEFSRQRPDAAVAAQCAAIARAPDLPMPYLDLSRLLRQLGRADESAAAERRARQLATLAR